MAATAAADGSDGGGAAGASAGGAPAGPGKGVGARSMSVSFDVLKRKLTMTGRSRRKVTSLVLHRSEFVNALYGNSGD